MTRSQWSGSNAFGSLSIGGGLFFYFDESVVGFDNCEIIFWLLCSGLPSAECIEMSDDS